MLKRSGGGWFCKLGVIAALGAGPILVAGLSRPADEQMLKTIGTVAGQGPFQPSWKSLEKFQAPDWYVDGKFGIFIHWGLYSVPAFGSEWYPRQMYLEGSKEFQHHLATFGPQARFGYKDFIPMFKAETVRPGPLGEAFQRCRGQYVVPVAEHHDGFAMYDTRYSDWSAAKMGPKRDIIGELADGSPRAGTGIRLSSHRAEHWWFYDGGHAIRFGREGSEERRIVRPREGSKKGREPGGTARPGLPG